MSRYLLRTCLAILLAAAGSGSAVAAAPTGDQPFFALITHKAGFAKGRAHNHLIVAGSPEVRLDFDAANPLETRFQMTTLAEQLVVDDPELQKAWYPRLEQLGILDEPFKGANGKQRAKIRATMLGPKQLHADRFPTIEARILSVLDKPSYYGGETFPYEVALKFSVHGQTATAPLAGRLQKENGHQVLEAVGTFQFTDFGIRPFSAFAGAVKNQDVFHVYARVAADP